MLGPGRVPAGDQVLQTDRIIVATGSDPAVPPIDGSGRGRLMDQPRGDPPIATCPTAPLCRAATCVELGLFAADRQEGTPKAGGSATWPTAALRPMAETMMPLTRRRWR
jgi:hypothetical protein